MTQARIGIGLLAVASVVIALAVGDLVDADLGNVPDWFEAIGTTGALLIGAFTLRQQVRDRHEEREREAHERSRKIELQVGGGSGVTGSHWDVTLHYKNGSAHFIYDVRFEAIDPSGASPGANELADLGPGERSERKLRVPWFEDFRSLRWTMSWRDHLGASWVRTHRGEVRRL